MSRRGESGTIQILLALQDFEERAAKVPCRTAFGINFSRIINQIWMEATTRIELVYTVLQTVA
jgi:hypothetical protein